MNIRFAEACRNKNLVLEGYEVQVAKERGWTTEHKERSAPIAHACRILHK